MNGASAAAEVGAASKAAEANVAAGTQPKRGDRAAASPHSGASSPDYSLLENPEAIQFLRGKAVGPGLDTPSPRVAVKSALPNEAAAAVGSPTPTLTLNTPSALGAGAAANPSPGLSPTPSDGLLSPTSLTSPTGMTSPLSPTGDGGRLVIRKKRKIPNKALKKLFKVVPKKGTDSPGPRSPDTPTTQKEWL